VVTILIEYNSPDLSYLLSPLSVAFIGVSMDANALGGRVLINLQKSHYNGKIYPVHTEYSEIFGMRTYPNLTSIPERVDIVVFMTDVKGVLPILNECEEKKVKFIILLPCLADMAGLLKPEAAYLLVTELKESVNIPIHLHTHDTSGNGVFTYARAIQAGVDIVDTALSSMAGLTSQPSANSLYYALEGNERRPNGSIGALDQLSHYWEDVRGYYRDFESGMIAPYTEVYQHEMPGGKNSNLQQQAKGVGLGERWDEVPKMYARVNQLFGDIVKVTPSSKVVGDMALFMVQNELTEEDVLKSGEANDFPDSVVELFQGYLGQPYGGFPEELQKVILKGKYPIEVRPGDCLSPLISQH
jgi:pyruvate carboxylase